MKVRIKETQEVKVLEIRDKNGIEWTNDLLGNYDALDYNKEAEEYEMNQEDYEWWSEYIKNHGADEQEVMELAEELGIEESEIWEKINQDLNCDLGDEHMIIQNVLEEIRKESYRKEPIMTRYINIGTVKGTGIRIVQIADTQKRYALSGWNGEKYVDSWEVDELGNAINPNARPIEITPIYERRGEDDFEIVDYKIQ